MGTATTGLDALAEELERRGDDAERLELVRRARNFKRAWIEMAEALVIIKRTEAWKRWGYGDLYEYCSKELNIRQATAEKLTMSYMTVRRYAPKVLDRDGVAHSVPSIETVDYFAKALGQRSEGGDEEIERDPQVVKELRNAVFDEGKPIAAIRKQFNPILFPKPDEDREREILQKTALTTRRLIHLVRNASGVTANRRREVIEMLESLAAEVQELLPDDAEQAAAPAA